LTPGPVPAGDQAPIRRNIQRRHDVTVVGPLRRRRTDRRTRRLTHRDAAGIDLCVQVAMISHIVR